MEESIPAAADSRCSIVALVGRPNVGKSTLFNRLTKSRSAIVDPTPGVTRDRHYQKLSWNDRTYILVDTGGIEPASGVAMTDMIRQQSLEAIAEADVICFLLDGRQPLTPTDHEISQLLRRGDKKVYFLVNKIDGHEQEIQLLPSFYELGADRLWPVSAEHGYGIPDFLDNLWPALLPSESGTAYPENTIRLACLGRPNVGKSSLINRFLGENRLLVSDHPGTTRDSVDSLLARDGNHYLLIDTAGIRRKGKVQEKLEKFSVIRSLAALDRCEIALILLDADEGITEQDTKVIGYTQDEGRACLILVNKWDLLKNEPKRRKQLLEEITMAIPFVGFAPVLTISALTGAGINKVFPAVHEIHRQFRMQFTTGKLNRLLQKSTEIHTPPLVRGRRLKFFYTTQLASAPPTFAIVTNAPKDVHFSYQRFLTNQFREGLGLTKVPVRLLFRERKRRP